MCGFIKGVYAIVSLQSCEQRGGYLDPNSQTELLLGYVQYNEFRALINNL